MKAKTPAGTFRRFNRFRTLQELKAELRKRKWKIYTERFDTGSSDFIRFDFKIKTLSQPVAGFALVSLCSGRFFGELRDGEQFDSNTTKHEHCRWFQILLETVYVESAPAAPIHHNYAAEREVHDGESVPTMTTGAWGKGEY